MTDVTQLDSNGGYDRVLADVPCSGTGTLARNPEIKWRLKPEKLAELHALQVGILEAALRQLRPGGKLVYSTCSLELEENDEQVARFLAEHPGWQLEAPPANAVPEHVLDGGFLRVLPQCEGTDGAFAARLRRPVDGATA